MARTAPHRWCACQRPRNWPRTMRRADSSSRQEGARRGCAPSLVHLAPSYSCWRSLSRPNSSCPCRSWPQRRRPPASSPQRRRARGKSLRLPPGRAAGRGRRRRERRRVDSASRGRVRQESDTALLGSSGRYRSVRRLSRFGQPGERRTVVGSFPTTCFPLPPPRQNSGERFRLLHLGDEPDDGRSAALRRSRCVHVSVLLTQPLERLGHP